GNVRRSIYALEPNVAMRGAENLEAGLIELVLRDAGVLNLAIAQFGAKQGMPPALAQLALMESVNQAAAKMAQANPDVRPAADAIRDFIGAPRGTLTIRLIPKGRVNIMAAIEAANKDPTVLLSQFRIEATLAR